MQIILRAQICLPSIISKEDATESREGTHEVCLQGNGGLDTRGICRTGDSDSSSHDELMYRTTECGGSCCCYLDTRYVLYETTRTPRKLEDCGADPKHGQRMSLYRRGHSSRWPRSTGVRSYSERARYGVHDGELLASLTIMEIPVFAL